MQSSPPWTARRTPRLVLACGAVIAFLAPALVQAPVRAATITVTTLADQYGSGAACSLREAIHAANSNAAFGGCPAGVSDDLGTDVVKLKSLGPYTLTRDGEDATTGDLDIVSSMEVRGVVDRSIIQAGAAEGSGIDRVFDLDLDDARVTLSSLIIRHGTTDGEGGGIYASGDELNISSSVLRDNQAGRGGGLYTRVISTELTNTSVLSNGSTVDGGGLLLNPIGNPDHFGSLKMRGGEIEENESVQGGGLNIFAGTASLAKTQVELNSADVGGGIYNCGTVSPYSLRLTSTLFANNIATTGDAQGGALAMCGGTPIKVANSTFFENFAGAGGALHLSSAVGLRHQITNSIFSSNESTTASGGGAIVSTSDLDIARSTFQYNRAPLGSGGAIQQLNGSLTIANSTLSSNGAGNHGGALYNQFRAVDILYSTFSNNAAGTIQAGGGPGGQGGAIYNVPAMPSGPVSLRGTILANSANGDDCGGVFISNGYNLIEEAAPGCDFGAGGTGDIREQDPQLRPLSNFGGRTPTHALQADSPALDAAAGDTSCPPIDQRGYARPGDGPDPDGVPACDIGAFEDRPPHERTLTLELKGHLRATGKLAAEDGFKPCRRGILIQIQRLKNGTWETVGSDATNLKGVYEEVLPDKPGDYRALAEQHQVSFKDARHLCHTALAPVDQHKH